MRLAKQKVKLDFSPETKLFLAKKGYSPHYGARPLKRAIQEQILNPLALLIVEKKVKEGDQLKVEVKKGKVVLER